MRRLLTVTGVSAVAAMAAGLMLFGEPISSPPVAVVQLLVPAVVLAGALVLAGWCGGEALVTAAAGPACRIALACAAAGFLLHNAVELSLWMPATGLVFAVAAGAALGRAPSIEVSLKPLRWPLAAAGVAGVIAAGVLLWRPVFQRTILTDRALASLANGLGEEALWLFDDAAGADPLDAVAAAEASDAIRAAAWDGKGFRHDHLLRSYHWARQAVQRDPNNPSWRRRAAETAWLLALDDSPRTAWLRRGALEPSDFVKEGAFLKQALLQMEQAVAIDPQDIRLRVEYAKMLVPAGRNREALEQLSRAEETNAQLEPQSFWRFSDAESKEVRSLLARAGGTNS